MEPCKLRSRQTHQNDEGGRLAVEWSECLGSVRMGEESGRVVTVRVYKSEPYCYNDKLLGMGDEKVVGLRGVRVPLLLRDELVGQVQLELMLSEETNSIKQSSGQYSSITSSNRTSSQTDL